MFIDNCYSKWTDQKLMELPVNFEYRKQLIDFQWYENSVWDDSSGQQIEEEKIWESEAS
jgi:hypothetical protein